MNDEEKRVMERVVDTFYSDSDLEKIILYKDSIRDVRILLNLIEKLQKENNDWQKAYQEEKDKQFDLIKENKELTKASIEAAFDDKNTDTELLLRCLLKYKKIKLENGMYTRDKIEWEEHMRLLGFEIKKEKLMFIGDDKVDEYTKQLEYKLTQKDTEIKKLQEKNEILKEIVSNIFNENEYIYYTHKDGTISTCPEIEIK